MHFTKHLLSPTIAVIPRLNRSRSLLSLLFSCSSSQIVNPIPVFPPPATTTLPIFRSLPRSPCRNFSSPSGSKMSQRKRSKLLNVNSDGSVSDFGEVMRLIREDTSRLESQLNQKNLSMSPSFVLEILCALNEEGITALRFFNWVLTCCPGFVPSAKIYNQLVHNLGRVNDYETMLSFITELSHKGFCLTEKAFAFLTLTRSIDLASSVRRTVDVLNGVAGSCKGSGIFSLVRHLCSVNAFDLATAVIEKTSRKTRYLNAMIAAMCKTGDFQGARNVLDEMPQSNCDLDMNSFNYILGCLLKHNRINETCDLLETMERLGFSPDPLTYELLVFHACKAGRIDLATQYLDRMLLEGLRPRITMHVVFIKGYFLSGREGDACKYVLDMSVRDKFSVNVNYSVLSSLFCKSNRVLEAGRVLYEMMEKGFRPNRPVYIRVVKMLHKVGRGDMASQLYSMFMRFSLQK